MKSQGEYDRCTSFCVVVGNWDVSKTVLDDVVSDSSNNMDVFGLLDSSVVFDNCLFESA